MCVIFSFMCKKFACVVFRVSIKYLVIDDKINCLSLKVSFEKFVVMFQKNFSWFPEMLGHFYLWKTLFFDQNTGHKLTRKCDAIYRCQPSADAAISTRTYPISFAITERYISCQCCSFGKRKVLTVASLWKRLFSLRYETTTKIFACGNRYFCVKNIASSVLY